MSPWILLIFAGLLEIVWAVGMKYSDGWTRLWPSVITIVAMIGSMALLTLAAKNLPLGTSYAVWTGIGAVGASTFGILFFHESAAPGRLVAIALILAGIVLLKLQTPA